VEENARPGARETLSLVGLGALFLGLGLAAYSTALKTGFLADDYSLIAAVRQRGVFSVWFGSLGGFVRPLVTLLYAVDLRLWGLHPLGFHITNILVHIVNAGLVALAAARLLSHLEVEAPRSLPVFSGLVFLLLPSHTESVTWI